MSKNVAIKIQKVMEEVSSINKVKSGGVNYAFQAWADVLPAIRSACIKHGLVIVPSMGQSQIGEWQGANSKSATHNVPLKFLLIDTDSGETVEAEWSGEARDVSDKGKQKAATSGMKYWLLKLFMVPDKETVQSDEHGDGTDEIKPEKKNGVPLASKWLADNKIDPKHKLFLALKGKFGDGWRKGVEDFLSACDKNEIEPTMEQFEDFLKVGA